ncbi:type 1 periplasmic-binding domain-containing protein [Actinoplanes siamensis]|uniref:ABC-type branched-subunit amino acid transport system substrate-binding protein n=1 Tax=Actinoplanes siamensis TaxID=1223317 RepID=A0A919N704_9ACTN|nr:hypothetical protein [Actinoplanes siamensis]GIF05507.1 hypothetical protein Asi03nite_30450 [Actinoplanes siamensis]
MLRRRWRADEAATRGIQFEGGPDLLRLISRLVRRPWRYGAERFLPILELNRPPAGRHDPFDGLQEWLREGRFAPWARTGERQVDPGRTPAVTVEDLLDVAVKNLAGQSRTGPRLRFPHYGLALWLVHLEPFQPDTPDREREKIAEQLQVHLRQRLPSTPLAEGLADAVGDFPWWVRLASRLVPRLGLRFMRSTWRPPRWFARHRLAGGRDFYQLAREFARPGFVAAHQDDVDALLVDAFLEDLRVAYRRTGVFGAGRRRTAYPLLLIDDDGPAARRLIESVEKAGDLRREPLLVVTNPVRARGAHSPADARMAYDAWVDRQLRFARDRSVVLPLELPAETGRPGDWTRLGEAGLPRRRVPWMSLVLPLVLLAALITVPWYNHDRCAGLRWPAFGSTLRREPFGVDGSQCVGLSDGRYRFFAAAPDDDLRRVEEEIAAVNAEVVKNPGHVTVVYLSTLTNTTAGGDPAALEELRGLAAAQWNSRTARAPIRLLLANGGDQMNYGGQAARLIAGAAGRLRIVAVTGLGVSRQGTKDALHELDAAGIPTLGTLLTADTLTSEVISYHQVSPGNSREAAVAAYYAREKLRVTEAAVYYSGDPADLYSGNLAEDVRAAFTARGITVRDFAAYRPPDGGSGADVTSLGRRACPGKPGYLVFYAGRPDEFDDFLGGMSVCSQAYPAVLAGDAITQFALSGQGDDYPGLPLDYISLAGSRAWGTDCARINKSVRFFTVYGERGYGDACVDGQASRAMFGWDAINTINAAIVQVRAVNAEAAVTAQSVLQGLNALTGANAVPGVTGAIDFSYRGDDPQLPAGKTVLIMGADASLRLLCGVIPGARKPDPGCPAD